MLNFLPKVSSLPSLLAKKPCESECIYFSNGHVTSCWSLDQGSCLGTSYTKSAPSLVWCPYIFCKWSYVFYLSRHPSRPLHLDAVHIYGWVIMDILIAKWKNASSIMNHQSKNMKKNTFTTIKMYILRKSAPFWKFEILMFLLCIFGLFILRWKILKTCNVKKNNSKCTNFTIKN